ncbi:MAG TPA: DUF3883 domain-containing protein, partial [Polyangiaceae bacterium]|nr:DUF3883 domain-containing protein [Polyangiaceae bacterium]
YAITRIVPRHVEEVRAQRLSQVEKTEREVKARLTKEISYWDRCAQDLKDKERAGKRTRLPAHVAQERADTLADRLQTRLDALQAERHIMPAPPRVTGGSLIIPGGLLHRLGAPGFSQADRAEVADAAERKRVELLAMDAVMAAERALGREPRDVSAERGLGYDIESKDPATGQLLFIEVKGRQAGASTVTLTKNEILAALNSAERFRLAIVEVDGDDVRAPVYVRGFDFGQPGFAQTSANFDLTTLLKYGGEPA